MDKDTKNIYSNLEEILEDSIFSDKDIFGIIEEKFDDKRKAVEFLISLILSYDDYRIYVEILSHYKQYLTEKEIAWITESAKMLFEPELFSDLLDE